jgi:hypothetical membrane protein
MGAVATFRAGTSEKEAAVTAQSVGSGGIRSGSPIAQGGLDTRIPGALFLGIGAAFLIVTMLAASIAPGYDFHGGKISDLGVIGETAMLFNVLLVAIGVLNAVGGYLVYRHVGRVWLFATFLLAGAGAMGAGIFPLNTGGLHSIFALLAFVLFNLEALAMAAVLRGPMRLLSAVAGVVGVIYVVVMLIGDGGNPAIFGAIGHGGSERMIAYPVMLWLLALGGYLLGSPVLGRGRR